MASPLIGSIGPFEDNSQEDWISYSERLEQFFAANSVANEKKVATLLSVIGPKTYSLLRNLTVSKAFGDCGTV